jgi:DNA-binding NarL/FixJ family response regulator
MQSSTRPFQRLPVAIVSDDKLATETLARALSRCSDIVVSGVYSDAWQASRAGIALQPRVVIVDIGANAEQQGVDIGVSLRRSFPNVGIVILTGRGDPHSLSSLPAEATRGWAFLLKAATYDPNWLERAIEGAASGLVVVDPSIVAKMRPRHEGALAALTAREHEILTLVAQGYSNSGIAQRLVLAEKSVENRLVEIYRKLDLEGGQADHNPRVQAVLTFLKHSVIDHFENPAPAEGG